MEYITVLGKDKLEHLALPHSHSTICGAEVIARRVPQDGKARYFCIKCDYMKIPEATSNCCNAPLVPETDLCSDCYEHCAPVFDCHAQTAEALGTTPRNKVFAKGVNFGLLYGSNTNGFLKSFEKRSEVMNVLQRLADK